MKIARFSVGGAIRFGIIDEEELVVLKADPMFAGFDTTGERVKLSDAKLLAPVIPRSKVIGVGRNYRAHAEELGNEVPEEPLVFLKPNTSVIGPEDSIVLPPESSRVDFEGELAVVIGKVARRVSVEDALDVVFGVTIANDVTARDLQKGEPQWTRGKGFDTFCPIGPFIETEYTLDGLTVETRLDGEVKQSGNTSDMIFGVAEVIAFVSAAMTLLPGDVILTGTPEGVGPMQDGQRVAVSVTGLGVLENPVVNERERSA
ncbi:fumarylacetoacetate hydrolase family protein [Humidisolicoccus flavus]|uniref:fumarylacetoacetate hydrolase family protein n=1 Tax=Humidisolicoccus flavus TaxID=3111414 RepID=UPI003245F776